MQSVILSAPFSIASSTETKSFSLLIVVYGILQNYCILLKPVNLHGIPMGIVKQFNSVSAITLNSKEKITYTYDGTTYSNYLGKSLGRTRCMRKPTSPKTL